MSFSDDTKPKLAHDVKPLFASDSERKPDLKPPQDYHEEKPIRAGDTGGFAGASVLSPDIKLSLKEDEKNFRLAPLTEVKIKKEKNDRTNGNISGNMQGFPLCHSRPKNGFLNQQRIVRARIYLRKQPGREPTTKELADGNDYKNITPEMIKQAFVDGDEEIYVYCVKCNGYDIDFQRNLATMPVGWEHPKVIARREGIKNGTVKAKSLKRKAPSAEDVDHPVTTSVKSSKLPLKRKEKKRKEIDENDRDDANLVMTISDNLNDSSETNATTKKPQKAYVSKGTRSRPIRL